MLSVLKAKPFELLLEDEVKKLGFDDDVLFYSAFGVDHSIHRDKLTMYVFCENM